MLYAQTSTAKRDNSYFSQHLVDTAFSSRENGGNEPSLHIPGWKEMNHLEGCFLEPARMKFAVWRQNATEYPYNSRPDHSRRLASSIVRM